MSVTGRFNSRNGIQPYFKSKTRKIHLIQFFSASDGSLEFASCEKRYDHYASYATIRSAATIRSCRTGTAFTELSKVLFPSWIRTFPPNSSRFFPFGGTDLGLMTRGEKNPMLWKKWKKCRKARNWEDRLILKTKPELCSNPDCRHLKIRDWKKTVTSMVRSLSSQWD